MRSLMLIIAATCGLMIAGANPVIAQAPEVTQGATTNPSAEAPAASAPLVPQEDTVNLSPGRGYVISGVAMLSVGTTGLIIAGFFYAMADTWGTNSQYSAGNIALAISVPTTVAGIVLALEGALLNENAREGAANRAVLLPMVTAAADGEGLVIGAVGTF